MLDTKGPEIRTGKLKGGKPVQLTAGQEITITTDYEVEGDASVISMSYKKLAVDVGPGSSILCADGSIVLECVSADPAAGTVRCVCKNTAVLGERKNVNLPGVVVDLPTLTPKDEEDLLQWGLPNEIDLIAASFVRKASDIEYIRSVLGEKGRYVKIISKVRGGVFWSFFFGSRGGACVFLLLPSRDAPENRPPPKKRKKKNTKTKTKTGGEPGGHPEL